MWANYSTDQKNFTSHMFNIKLEEKSCKMSFKALPVKIQQSKNRQEGHSDVIDNRNFKSRHFSRKGFHLNDSESKLLARKFLEKIKLF